MRRARRLLPAALLAACGCAPSSAASSSPAVIPLDLATIPSRAAELDGRRVEFDAYIYSAIFSAKDGSVLFLKPTPGREETLADGTRRMLCRGSRETSLPVVLRRGLGPLLGHGLDKLGTNRFPRVTIRAVFRNARFSHQDHWLLSEYPGSFEDAKIVRVGRERCILHVAD